jgi:hypothetical protein
VSLDHYREMMGSNVSQFDKNDADTLVGVIARSAGVWDSKCFFLLHGRPSRLRSVRVKPC